MSDIMSSLYVTLCNCGAYLSYRLAARAWRRELPGMSAGYRREDVERQLAMADEWDFGLSYRGRRRLDGLAGRVWRRLPPKMRTVFGTAQVVKGWQWQAALHISLNAWSSIATDYDDGRLDWAMNEKFYPVFEDVVLDELRRPARQRSSTPARVVH